MRLLVGYGWDADATKQLCFPVYRHVNNGFNVFVNYSAMFELFVRAGGAWHDPDQLQLAKPVSHGSITAYAWPAGKTKQVCYFSDDHDILELAVKPSSNWHANDLTAIAAAPDAGNGHVLTAFAWNKGGTKQVAYVGADNHIHELYVGLTGPWRHADLTAITGAAPYGSGEIAGYAGETLGTKQVVYKDASDHIHELYTGVGGSWAHADLTALASAPLATGDFLKGYAWENGGTKQVVYTTADGHIHELAVSAGQTWLHTDLTALTQAPPAAAGGQGLSRPTNGRQVARSRWLHN